MTWKTHKPPGGFEVQLVLGPLGQQIRRVPELKDVLEFVLAPDADGRCETVRYVSTGTSFIAPRYVCLEGW